MMAGAVRAERNHVSVAFSQQHSRHRHGKALVPLLRPRHLIQRGEEPGRQFGCVRGTPTRDVQTRDAPSVSGDR